MRIHYVEDNASDALILTTLVERHGGIVLDISPKIDDFEHSVARDSADFILLDVYRPDSVSIEDDIRRLRGFTDAPIVLVTSDGSDLVRRKAFAGGAEAVLDKQDINIELIRQIAINSTLRHKLQTEDKLQQEGRVESAAMKVSIETLGNTFSYIELSLQTLYETMTDSGRDTTAEYIGHLLETVRAIRTYSQDDLSTATRAPIHKLLIQTAERVSRSARARGVDLIMESETSWFTQMGSEPLAGLGLQHLIGGLIRACDSGDRISVRTEKDEHGIVLNIFLSRAIVDSIDHLFELHRSSRSMGLDAKASIQLGLTLLSVPREQVEVDTHKKNQFIKIRI